MADAEEIFRGLISLQVDDGDIVAKVQRVVQAASEALQQLGSVGSQPLTLPGLESLSTATLDAERLLAVTRELGVSIAGLPGMDAYVAGLREATVLLRQRVALESEAANIERLNAQALATQQRPGTGVRANVPPPAEGEEGFRPNASAVNARLAIFRDDVTGDPLTTAQNRLTRAYEQEEEAAKRKYQSQGAADNALYDATVRRQAAEDRVAQITESLEKRLNSELTARAEREVATNDPRYANLVDPSAASGQAILEGAGVTGDAAARARALQARLAELDTARQRSADSAEAVRGPEELNRVYQQRISIERQVLNIEEEQRLAAQAVLDRIEEQVRAQASRAAVASDPLLATLTQNTDEAGRNILNANGVSEDASVRSQYLQAQRERLLIERENNAKAVSELAASTEVQNAEEALSKLKAQRLSIEQRILANANAQIAQAGRDDVTGAGGGRSGFFNGLVGSFGGGGQGGGSIGELAFQAGQATKYYALYTVLNDVQRIFVKGFEDAQKYTLAVNDLGLAMGTTAQQANDYATNVGQLGQQYGASPIEAIQGATKFIRSFDPATDPASAGLSQQQIGDLGATLTSIIQQLEGQTQTPKTIQDLIGLTKAYNLGPDQAQTVYDQVTSVAKSYGYASGGEVLSGVTQIGDIGRESGYDIPHLAALIASVMQQTGVGSDAAAGDVKRFLGGQSTLEPIFQRFGISAGEGFSQRLDQLFSKIQSLPEDQRATVLNSLGGARIGAAVSAAITTLPGQNAAAAKAQDASGLSAELATRRMEQLGGAVDKLKTQFDALIVSLINSGLADGMTLVVQGLGLIVGALTAVQEAINAVVPAPVREFATAIGTLTAALLIGRAAAAALADSETVLALKRGLGAILGGGTSAAAGVAETATPGVTRGLAIAAGEDVGALGAGAVAGEAATGGLAASLGGLAASAGAAAAAVAPLVIAIGGIVAAKGLIDFGQQYTGSRDAYTGTNGQHGDAAGLDYQLFRPDQDPAALSAAIKKVEADRKALSDAATSSAGRVESFLGDNVIGPLTGNGTGSITSQTNMLLAGMDNRIAVAKAALDAINATAQKAVGGANSLTAYFGPNLDQISQGILRITGNREGIDRGTDIFGQLLGATQDPSKLQDLITPVKGKPGSEQLLTYLLQRAGRMTDPQAQEGELQKIQQVFAQYGTATNKAFGAGSTNSDTVAEQVDQANKAYSTAVISDANAKIARIKALNKDTPQAQAALRAVVSEALAEVGKTGDVSALITLLNGADQAMANASRATLQAQIAALQSQQKSLQTAVQAAAQVQAMALQAAQQAATSMSFFATQNADQPVPGNAAGAGMVGLSNVLGGILASPGAAGASAEVPYPARVQGGAQARLDAINQQIADGQKRLAAFNSAVSQSAPSGSDFKFPKNTAAQGPTAEQIELARINSTAIPADPLSQATVAVEAAQYQLRTAKNSLEYYTALKALRDAQYQLGKSELDNVNAVDLSHIDITDPVAQANLKVREAQRQLSFDQGRGALSDVTTTDRNNLRQAQSAAQKAGFDQQFGDYQTNYDLNRISLSSYLNYLNSQHDYLSAVRDKSRQQIDELNQVDRALKGLTNQLQGQFNLGSIKVPSVYEVRRALAAGTSVGAQAVSYVTITVNGADTGAVRSMLNQYVGVGATQTVGTGVRK